MAHAHSAQNYKKMSRTLFDRFAIALSGLCAIHCVAIPLLAGVIPVLNMAVGHGNHVHDFWFHQFILLFIFPISVIALVTGFRCHRQFRPLVIASIGLMLLLAMALLAEPLMHNQIIKPSDETTITILGGIIHAVGHIANILATRKSHTKCATS